MPLLSSFAITRLYLEVASSLFSGIICLYLFLLYQEATPTVRIFRKFSVTIFAENLVDLLCGYLNGMVTYENTLVVPAPLILFVNLVDVVGGCLCSYYFLQYACVHAVREMVWHQGATTISCSTPASTQGRRWAAFRHSSRALSSS